MMPLDVEAIRAEVRALDYARGTADEANHWRRADADALFDMLRDEAVPPELATQIVLKLMDHPDADRSLAITPVGTSW